MVLRISAAEAVATHAKLATAHPGGNEMRFYNQPHQYYCGGDLHARTLYLHVLDAQGKTCFEKNLPASPTAFLDAVAPFRECLVVGVECMFAWYWLADLCEEQGRHRRNGEDSGTRGIHRVIFL